jgi:energy-converting hydrogenase A subunit M
VDEDAIKRELLRLIDSGMTKRDAVREAAASLNINKNEVYRVSLNI